MRSQLKGESVGEYGERRRGRPAAGSRGAAEQRAVGRRMHGEEGMERDEYETGLRDMMEEEEWKGEVGIDENDDGEERTRGNEDERMNMVDMKQNKQERRRRWEHMERNDMEEFENNWGETGRICNVAAGAWMKPQRIWDDISGKELDWELVAAARVEEMEEFRKHDV